MSRIRMQNVSFAYGRGALALRGVDLELGDGIIGLVGPNGAGKTTLLRLLLGAAAPTGGSVTIDDTTPADYRTAHGVGYVGESALFDRSLTVGEFLDGLADLIGCTPPARTPNLERLASNRLSALSTGQRRQIEIAAALTGDPQLVLLDEPTNGLDPDAVQELRTTIATIRAPGRTILISSHHLDELQRIVDHVVLIRAGEVRTHLPREAVVTEYGSFDALFAAHRAEVAS